MKTIIKLRTLILFAALAVVTISCEDYLEDELLSDTSVDFLNTTADGLEAATVGLYAINREIWEDSEWNYAAPLVPIAKSDLTIGRSGELALYARLGWGADLGSFGTRRLSKHWRTGYRMIDRANQIINAAPNVNMDEDKRNQILAQARMFRAHAYFTLYRQFNNIFVTTEPTNPENAFDVPSQPSTEEEIFALINSDVDFAIEHLEWTTDQFGRWTKASAKHVRAKTAMWQEDWETAAIQAEEVINNPNYSLVSTTAEVFDGNMNHSESLFVIQYEDATIGGSTSNRIHFNFIPQYNRLAGADWSIENGSRGFGGMLMNDYLIDLLAQDPNDDRDDGSYYITEYKYNDEANLPPGVALGQVITEPSRQSDPRNYYLTLNPGTVKYLQEDAVVSEANSISNIMIYRLAETYLIASEANFRMNNQIKAVDFMNAVRNRAGAADVTVVDQTAVLDERARELGFEGQRFYTLKRMGVYEEFIRNHASNEGFVDQARERVRGHMVNWPIPNEEINLLAPGYPQNAGYTD